MVKTIKTASRGEGKTAKPDFVRWKYTPFGANAPPFPRRGHFYRRYCTCQQKLDTKLKKLGIKIEYLYKAQ